ncbi:MAG: hypothetical protein JGK33_10080 [Microcoleus sp. PH2017_11_PCY_U_A]|nr:hypothetical protein [Microcoleus sp. PH2017_11_PCY_U_A]
MAISNDGRELLDKMFSLVQTPETRAASAGMKTTNVAAFPLRHPDRFRLRRQQRQLFRFLLLQLLLNLLRSLLVKVRRISCGKNTTSGKNRCQ